MQRVIIDTNLYIDWMNDGRYEGVIFKRDAVKYLSAVVMMELSAGAFLLRDRRLVKDVTSAFARAGRIVAPTVAVYREAGVVLRRLQRLKGYTIRGTYGLVNDVLIALSARSIGATVITQNERDFAAIRGVRSFELAVVGE